MGIVIRQSFYNSIFSYLGVIIGFINVIFLFPAFLSEVDIGLYRAIQNASLLLLPFATFGLQASTLKFFPEAQQKESTQDQFLGFMLVAVTFFYLIFLAFYFLFQSVIHQYFAEKAQPLIDSFNLVLILVFILSFQTVIEAYSRNLLKTIFPGFLRDFFFRFLISVSVLLFAINLISFEALLNSLIGIYLIVLLLLLLYLYRDTNFQIRLPTTKAFGSLGKRILGYSFFIFLGFSGSTIIVNVDSIMISSMLGLAQTGIYVTAMYMGNIIELPKRSIGQITAPLLAKAFEEKNLKEVDSLYKKVSINQSVIGTYLLLGILVNLDNIFSIMPNSEVFAAGRYVVLFIGLGKLIDMIFSFNGEIILFSHFYKFNVTATIILGVLTIATNLLLIPVYGISGAAFASLLTLFLFNIIKFVFLKIKLNMQPFNFNTLKVIAFGLITYYLVSIIPQLPVWIDLLIRSILVTVIFGSLILFFKCSEEISNLSQGGWKQLFKKN
ncbi:MAG TPA: polysaccharide biosynthesis C-terminal domain-containing protein [Cyclobacteriaceae bacterium]|jgi:O-antigen/teichoic acid export membrane protein